MVDKPLLSVVIANYNYGRFLPDAIESILSQGHSGEIEIIVCDGGSSDDSREVIKRYASQIAWWCSENDEGQSAAFNKGFAHARGRFLTWLNADDMMLPETYVRFKAGLRRYPSCEWFVGGSIWCTPDLKVHRCVRPRKFSRFDVGHGIVNVWGPSSIFARALYERVGRIDERFQYMMDIDLWLRFAVKEHARYRIFARYAWCLRLHRDAKMSGHKFTEDGRILEGEASKNAFNAQKQKTARLALEREWMNGNVGLPRKRMSFVGKVFTRDYINTLYSLIDTRNFKGQAISLSALPLNGEIGVWAGYDSGHRHDDSVYKRELLDLLRRIDVALTRCNIRYFAVYGTCLGAVRDHGIIPWDDDVDIAVWRKDFKKVIEAINQSGEELFAGDRHHVAGCPIRCGRVFNRVGRLCSVERRRAYVDLHVIDYAPRTKSWFRWLALWYVGVTRIVARRRGIVNRQHPALYFLADIAAFPLRLFPSEVLFRLSDWIYADERVTPFVKITYDGNRKRYKACSFLETKRQPFGAMSIAVPNGYEDYLTACYGEWRIRPPLADRNSHAYGRCGEVWTVPYPLDLDRLAINKVKLQ